MKIEYLKIIIFILFLAAVIQVVFAQTEIPKPVFKDGYTSFFNRSPIYVVFHPKDSLFGYDTINRTIPYRDFFYSDDSSHVKDNLKYAKFSM
jgi:hypothetical protein